MKVAYHFISQDAIYTLLIERCEPVQSLQLIVLQLGVKHVWLRDIKLVFHGAGVLEVQLVRVD